jgi:hypothetical protein
MIFINNKTKDVTPPIIKFNNNDNIIPIIISAANNI